jgi:hypothetical protein
VFARWCGRADERRCQHQLIADDGVVDAEVVTHQPPAPWRTARWFAEDREEVAQFVDRVAGVVDEFARRLVDLCIALRASAKTARTQRRAMTLKAASRSATDRLASHRPVGESRCVAGQPGNRVPQPLLRRRHAGLLQRIQTLSLHAADGNAANGWPKASVSRAYSVLPIGGHLHGNPVVHAPTGHMPRRKTPIQRLRRVRMRSAIGVRVSAIAAQVAHCEPGSMAAVP